MPVATLTIPYPDDISDDMDALLHTSKACHLMLVIQQLEDRKVAILSGRPEDVVLAARKLRRRADEIELLAG